MNILADATETSQHPSWCDTRFCDAGQHVDVRHLSTPLVVKPTDDDVEIALHLCQDDDRQPDGTIVSRQYGVQMVVENLECRTPDGNHAIKADTYLTFHDAEELAFRLLEIATTGRRAAAEAAQ